MIEHHLDDELLIGYAAGTLSEGWSIGVATHLSMCPSCRGRLIAFESLGGHFLECEDAKAPEPSDWDAMKARVEASVPEKKEKPPSRGNTLLPQPLFDYIEATGGLKWKSLGRGAAQIKIPTSDPSTMVRLLKIPAGKPVPEHSHRGLELTLVLDGSFHDEISVFKRGDVELADGDLTHQPIASEDGDCICLAITDAPLRFKSRIVRMLQPLLGI